jgi:hypothetical protein
MSGVGKVDKAEKVINSEGSSQVWWYIYACNPSYLEAEGLKVQGQPGQKVSKILSQKQNTNESASGKALP